MRKSIMVMLLVCFGAWPLAAAADWKVTTEKIVEGFGHPESVAYDPKAEVLYISNFGPELKPLQKDGQGYISRVDLKGVILEEKYLPGPEEALHKPKGIWISGDLLWTTDIDSVWVFDLKTKSGRQEILPGAMFANDSVVSGDKLYVSDTGTGTIFQVQPADFRNDRPTVEQWVHQSGLAPNGLCSTHKGDLLFCAFPGQSPPGRIYRITGQGKYEPISEELGRLDGLAELPDGTLIYTDWEKKGLFAFGPDGKSRLLVGGINGPADFTIIPQNQAFLVVVPDLVKGELRFFTLEK